MPKAVKVMLWVLAFAAAIAAGAYQASRSDPFPPGVEDPGARASEAPKRATPSSPQRSTARLRMRITSEHVLHVGGSCESRWLVEGTVSIGSSGRATGQGRARLREPARCDFHQSQVQTRAIELAIAGEPAAGGMRLSFREARRSPVGSQDLGGLPSTLRYIHPEVPVDGGSDSVRATRPDGDLGRYTSSASLTLSLQ